MKEEEVKQKLIELVKQVSEETLDFFVKKIDENNKLLSSQRTALGKVVMASAVNIGGNMIASLYGYIKVDTKEERRKIIEGINESYIDQAKKYFASRIEHDEKN